MIKTVCGIELKGSEARFVILRGTKQTFEELSPNFKKVTLQDHSSQELVRSFVQTVYQHLREQGVCSCVVNARNTKGDHAGGPVSFKLEGLIQMGPCPVRLIHPATLRASLKRYPIPESYAPSHAYLRVAAELAFFELDAEA